MPNIVLCTIYSQNVGWRKSSPRDEEQASCCQYINDGQRGDRTATIRFIIQRDWLLQRYVHKIMREE